MVPYGKRARIAVAFQNNAALDGGVHGLYTIAGRSDARGCSLAQPNFAQQLANNNVSFQISTTLRLLLPKTRPTQR